MPQDRTSTSQQYTTGANLGGWLVMEDWLFPNVPLMRLGMAGIEDNQEYDYVRRMVSRGIDAVATMQNHWNTYLSPDLLSATEPPEVLQQLKAAGATRVRIPVGWWAFEAPSIPRPPDVEGGGDATAGAARVFTTAVLFRGLVHQNQM